MVTSALIYVISILTRSYFEITLINMATNTGPKPTMADLDALPAGVVGEIIEGVLYTMTKPRARHQLMAMAIAYDLRAPFGLGRGGPGGWWIIAEPGIELPETPEIAPDVAWWRRDHMPKLPAPDEPLRVVPDWVCEVRIPLHVCARLRGAE